MQRIRRRRLELSKVHIERARLLALGVDQDRADANLLTRSNRSQEGILDQRLAEPVTLLAEVQHQGATRARRAGRRDQPGTVVVDPRLCLPGGRRRCQDGAEQVVAEHRTCLPSAAMIRRSGPVRHGRSITPSLRHVSCRTRAGCSWHGPTATRHRATEVPARARWPCAARRSPRLEGWRLLPLTLHVRAEAG